MNTVFKIRDRDTGLYSTGGQEPQWDATGKTWKNIGHLKCHLRNWSHCYDDYGYNHKARHIPASWEVVAFEVVATERDASPATAFYCAKVFR